MNVTRYVTGVSIQWQVYDSSGRNWHGEAITWDVAEAPVPQEPGRADCLLEMIWNGTEWNRVILAWALLATLVTGCVLN